MASSSCAGCACDGGDLSCGSAVAGGPGLRHGGGRADRRRAGDPGDPAAIQPTARQPAGHLGDQLARNAGHAVVTRLDLSRYRYAAGQLQHQRLYLFHLPHGAIRRLARCAAVHLFVVHAHPLRRARSGHHAESGNGASAGGAQEPNLRAQLRHRRRARRAVRRALRADHEPDPHHGRELHRRGVRHGGGRRGECAARYAPAAIALAIVRYWAECLVWPDGRPDRAADRRDPHHSRAAGRVLGSLARRSS